MLNAVNLIKQKRDGTIKGRTCADGSKQKICLGKDESVASLTVSLESLFTTLVIDAYEERDIATFDIPGAYLHAEMPADKNVILKLRGHFVDIVCDINKEYRQYVRYEKDKKVLYLKVLREIYGCIELALQWYNLYTQTLKAEGYILKEYNRCVANKNINGKQCTVAGYVDYNKASHVDSRVIGDLLDIIKTHFGEIKITRGKKHTFLGMNLLVYKMSTVF